MPAKYRKKELRESALNHLEDYLFGLAFAYSIIIKFLRYINIVKILSKPNQLLSLQGIQTSGLQYFKFMARRSQKAGLLGVDQSISRGTVWARTTWPLSLIAYRIDPLIYNILSLTLFFFASEQVSSSIIDQITIADAPIRIGIIFATTIGIVLSNSIFFQILNLTWEIIPWSLSLFALSASIKGKIILSACYISLTIFFHPSIALFSLLGCLPNAIQVNTSQNTLTTTSLILSTAIIIIGGAIMYSLLANWPIPGIKKQIHERCRSQFLNIRDKISFISHLKMYLTFATGNKARNSNIIHFLISILTQICIFQCTTPGHNLTPQQIIVLTGMVGGYALLDAYNRYNFFMSKYTLNTYGLFINLSAIAILTSTSSSIGTLMLSIIALIIYCNARFSGYEYLLDAKGGNLIAKPMRLDQKDRTFVNLAKKNITKDGNILIYNISNPRATFNSLPKLCYLLEHEIEDLNFLLSPVNELLDPVILTKLYSSKPGSFKAVIEFAKNFNTNNITLILISIRGHLNDAIPDQNKKILKIIPMSENREYCIINIKILTQT